MYQLKFQNNWPAIERCASQVTEYLNQTQSPSFNPNSENHTHLLVGFSKYMFLSYQSTHYWNKADRLTAEPSLKGTHGVDRRSLHAFLLQIFSNSC